MAVVVANAAAVHITERVIEREDVFMSSSPILLRSRLTSGRRSICSGSKCRTSPSAMCDSGSSMFGFEVVPLSGKCSEIDQLGEHGDPCR